MTNDLEKQMHNFLFETGLYDAVDGEQFFDLILNKAFIVDSYCPECDRKVAFKAQEPKQIAYITKSPLRVVRTLQCSRNSGHVIRFWIKAHGKELTKLGQEPTYADLARGALKTYRARLSKQDATELGKAIGLAAHDAGVGAFVYLRRVFERLINRRFDEHKASEGWNESEFQKSRMEDKIHLMRAHLPEFMVKNRKIYSILSLGIHELDEQQCRDAFGFLRASLVAIFEEDAIRKEQRAIVQEAEKGISAFLSGRNEIESKQAEKSS